MVTNYINIFDYPKDLYTHYWEIQINPGTDQMSWKVTFYPYDPVQGDMRVYEGSTNLPQNGTPDERMLKARELSQKFVLSHIEAYHRTPEDIERRRLAKEAAIAKAKAEAQAIETAPVRDGDGNIVTLDSEGNPIYTGETI